MQPLPKISNGFYTLGDLALYTGIILQVRRSLYILIANTGDIYDMALATIPIFQLLALEPQYRIFRTIAQGRMAVVVSHRLALAKLADRIVVLEQGRIVEEGNHEELMARGDRYHAMFTRQASSYL